MNTYQPYESPITGAGVFTLSASPGARFDAYVSGSFAGHTVTFGYIDDSNEFAPYRNQNGQVLTASSSGGISCPSPESELIAVKVGEGVEACAIVFNIVQSV